ncbi:hypothetical protein NI18_20600, partial [Sphingomonas sp. Ant20]
MREVAEPTHAAAAIKTATPARIPSPAEAGAQLGDGDDEALSAVTATFPTGPRPCGVVAGDAGDTRRFVRGLFSRGGGSPAWVPAF